MRDDEREIDLKMPGSQTAVKAGSIEWTYNNPNEIQPYRHTGVISDAMTVLIMSLGAPESNVRNIDAERIHFSMQKLRVLRHIFVNARWKCLSKFSARCLG